MPNQTVTDAQEVEDVLGEALDALTIDDFDDTEIGGMLRELGALRRVETFAQAGVMTYNAGLVLSFANGAEFQITIVQSQSAS